MPIRVLVVDDSAVMRSLLRMVLAAMPEVELAGMAADGVAAVEMIGQLKPDLVLLDIEMPRMNGLEVLAELRVRNSRAKTGPREKIIMCSTLTRRGAGITLEALASGATDYVTKPSGQNGPSGALEALAAQLVPRIHALCAPRSSFSTQAIPALPAMKRDAGSAYKAVVIGVSTGGPAALEVLLPALPGDFPLPILLVQHMPQVFTALLAERLNNLCALRVCEASPGAAPAAGTVYIARGDWHLEVVAPAFTGMPIASGPRLRLTQAAPLQHCRPSVDVLFHSSVAVYGGGVIAMILTGMGSDGLAGCRAVRKAGGTVLTQDQASSAVWGMPGVVAQAGLVQRVLPLSAMAAELMRLVACSPRPKLWTMPGATGATA